MKSKYNGLDREPEMVGDDVLRQIEQRLAATSDGEWVAILKGSRPVVKRITTDSQGLPIARNVATIGCGNHYRGQHRDREEADAEFIAHCKADIRILLSAVRSIEKRLRGGTDEEIGS